jgi:hypothetical protein
MNNAKLISMIKLNINNNKQFQLPYGLVELYHQKCILLRVTDGRYTWNLILSKNDLTASYDHILKIVEHFLNNINKGYIKNN